MVSGADPASVERPNCRDRFGSDALVGPLSHSSFVERSRKKVTAVDCIELPDMEAFAMLGGAERDRVAMDVERAFRKVAAFRSQMIHTVDASQSYPDDFHHSAANWFCGVTNTSKSSA